jgi:hypothetical protein
MGGAGLETMPIDDAVPLVLSPFQGFGTNDDLIPGSFDPGYGLSPVPGLKAIDAPLPVKPPTFHNPASDTDHRATGRHVFNVSEIR